MERFENRTDAGQRLAKKLVKLIEKKPLVLALPRGGILVAAPIAQALGAPLNILAVKKITLSRHPEFAVGAVSEDGIPFLNEVAIAKYDLDRDQIQRMANEKTLEVREQTISYRDNLPFPLLAGQHVILVDDGTATGMSIEAAIQVLRNHQVESIHIAVPVCAPEAYLKLKDTVESLTTILIPADFHSIGSWYEDFHEIKTEESLQILNSITPKSPLDLEIERLSRSLNRDEDLHSLAAKISTSRIVMLGESSNGTKEFYEIRRKLTQILIQEHGFDFVAAEADWPDCQEINKYIRTGRGTARESLKKFARWPTWMWANEEMVPFVENMRRTRTDFFGLDVYSLFESIDAILDYSKKLHPEIAATIGERYACFDPYHHNEFTYAKSLVQFPEGFQQEVQANLTELLDSRMIRIGLSSPEIFDMKQNARLITHAEEYYRAMLEGGPACWNLRDRHMLETLEILLKKKGPRSKAIVWSHNTHIGDYRATHMLGSGHVNLGGLARQTFGRDNVSLVGFGTYQGTVLAAHAWGATEEMMPLPPPAGQSIEKFLHAASERLDWPRFYMVFDEDSRQGPLAEKRMHRAVGVVYQPQYETFGGNDVSTSLSERYDAFVFVDRSSALECLHGGRVSQQFIC